MSYLQTFKSSKWFKPAAVVLSLLVLLIVAILAIPRLIDINSYKGRIQSELEIKLGRIARLGNLKLSLFPGIRVEAADVAIGEDPKIASGNFITSTRVRLRMPLFALLRGNPQVGGIELTEPQISIIRMPDARWNWETLKPLQEPDKGSAEMAPLDLVVTNGQFTIDDRSVIPASKKIYNGINLDLNNFSTRTEFDFKASMIVPNGQVGRLELDGSAGPIDRVNFANTPIDARVRAVNADLSSLESLAGIKSTRSGHLTLDGQIKGRLAQGLKMSGKMVADKLSLVSNVEPAPHPLETDFKLNLVSTGAPGLKESDYNIEIERSDIGIGKTRFTLSGQVSKLVTKPYLNIKLKGDNVDIANLLESAYAFGIGPPKGTTAGGVARVDLQAVGDASSPELTGQAGIRNLNFKSAGLPQAISVSELKLDCKPNIITAAPFKTTLGSRTAVDISALSISDYAKMPRAHVEVSTDNGQIDDLLRIAESFGIKTNLTGSGVASLKAVIDTKSDGTTNSDVSISGQGRLQQAKLSPQGFAKPLEINQADIKFTGNNARVDNFNAQLGQSAASGWLDVRNFSRPDIGFDLKINQVNVSELQQIVAGYKSTGTASGLSAAGKVWIGKVVVENLSFTDVQGTLAYKDDILKLDPIGLNLYGGGYQGAATIDQKQKEPAVALNGRVSGVDLNPLLTAFMGQKSVIYGHTDGAFNIRGRGMTGDTLMKSLAGQGNILVSNGKITSFDLMKQIEIFGKLVGLPSGGAGTAFRSLKTNFSINNGRLRTDALVIVMDDITVNGDGYMNLGDVVTADYDILAKLSPTLSKRFIGSSDQQQQQQQGGVKSSIDKFLGKVTSVTGSFFADQGQIVVPLHMTGPINSPSFSLNAALIQKRATEKFIGKPEEPMKKIFELFQKKKPIPQ